MGFHRRNIHKLSTCVSKNIFASCSKDFTVKIWNLAFLMEGQNANYYLNESNNNYNSDNFDNNNLIFYNNDKYNIVN